MASYSPNVPDTGATPSYQDDELLDLLPIFDTLLRWWREILLVTVVAAILGAGLALSLHYGTSPSYEASVQVAIARVVSNVNLDDAIKTTVNAVGPFSQDSSARRNSLLGLVKNGSIANEVLDELGPLLKGTTPSALVAMISSEFVGDQVSDLLKISAIADTPDKAAAIANSWAKQYVNHINALYGETPPDMTELVGIELGKAQTTYDTAQKAYEDYLSKNDIPTLARQIDEKKQFISILEAGRQTGLQAVVSQTLDYRKDLITSYQSAIQENQLLAMQGEQASNRTLVQNLIQAIGENRQLAFSKDHDARVKLFTQYADLELQNRLLAIQQEQDAKTQIFKAYSDADLKSKLSVFNQQVDDKVGGLVNSYATKQRIDQLLDEAKGLQTQIAQAGDAGASSNSLPLLLLKIESYAAGTTNAASSPLRYDLTGSQSLETDSKSQATDIAVLIDTLTAAANELGQRIEQQSQTLANNEGYQLLSDVRPQDDALYAAIQEQYLRLFQVDGLAQSANGIETQPLSQAIIAKYDELFGLGSAASASLAVTDTTPIYAALASQYPSLFSVGDVTQLGDLLAANSALDSASQKKLIEMLQPSADLESYLSAAAVGSQPIEQLEDELRTLEATLEAKQAEHDQFLRERDMALQAYNELLNSKLLELTLQRTVANREVCLASAANPPDQPIPGINFLLVGIVFGFLGFLFAAMIALVAAHKQTPPFLSTLRHAPVMPASQATPQSH